MPVIRVSKGVALNQILVLLKLRAQIHSFIDISLPKTPTWSFYIALPALNIQALCFLVLGAPFLVHDDPFTVINYQPAANELPRFRCGAPLTPKSAILIIFKKLKRTPKLS